MHCFRKENVCQVHRVCDTVCSYFVVKHHFELHMKDIQAHVNMKMIINMSIINFQIMTMFTQLYQRVCDLLAFGRNVHDGIISIKRFKTIKLLYPHQCTNPGRKVNAYTCVIGIDFVYGVPIEC